MDGKWMSFPLLQGPGKLAALVKGESARWFPIIRAAGDKG
jgi:hypothetical protein